MNPPVQQFADIIINRQFEGKGQTVTYSIPENLTIKPGQIVEIPLRNSRLKGVVFKVHQNEPTFKTKPVSAIIENAPHLNLIQIEMLEHLSDYYFTPLQKCLKLLLPPNFLSKKKFNLPNRAALESEQHPTNEINPFFHQLTPEQKAALETIRSTSKTCLLHGITGSGKTEIYQYLAEETIRQNKQVLILIPEISLTPQTVQNFQKKFGENIAVFHSHLTPKKKENYWYQVHSQQTKLIIGSRSAIFAPFQNLGLIVIDEEHEDSYKQDQAPRYHARDLAIWLADKFKCRLILGSATPSIESYHQTKNGNYQLVEMNNRIPHAIPETNSPLPKIKVVDLREEMKKKNYSIFSEYLQSRLTENLAKKEQSILFLNRRGAASALICRDCGEREICPDCDISLTYHKKILLEDSFYPTERLICHHCARVYPIPKTCSNCQSHAIKYIGIGTQRIEEEILKLFPDARVLRADRDTTKKAGDFEKIYNQFKAGQADILIGTQMIGKGLHLPNVTLVGVILADLSLTIPDFRASEKTFQLLTQVAGRSGRTKPGEVVIQTYQPEHYSILDTLHHDYQGFFGHEIHHRRETNFPPFSRFLKLTISTPDHQKTFQLANTIFNDLQKKFAAEPTEAVREITCFPALITKLKNKYRWNILLSGPNPREFFEKFHYSHPLKNDIKIDVDPLSTI